MDNSAPPILLSLKSDKSNKSCDSSALIALLEKKLIWLLFKLLYIVVCDLFNKFEFSNLVKALISLFSGLYSVSLRESTCCIDKLLLFNKLLLLKNNSLF